MQDKGLVSVTDKGMTVIEDLIAKTRKTTNHAFENMSAEETQQLNELLKRVFNTLS